MTVRHADKKLQRLETQTGYSASYGSDVVKSYRRRMQFIRSAANEQDFYAMKSLHYEKRKGSRSSQRSMRLNDQFRLILQLEQDPGGRVVVIVSIEDYH